jgi:hypothetical protein
LPCSGRSLFRITGKIGFTANDAKGAKEEFTAEAAEIAEQAQRRAEKNWFGLSR